MMQEYELDDAGNPMPSPGTGLMSEQDKNVRRQRRLLMETAYSSYSSVAGGDLAFNYNANAS